MVLRRKRPFKILALLRFFSSHLLFGLDLGTEPHPKDESANKGAAKEGGLQTSNHGKRQHTARKFALYSMNFGAIRTKITRAK